MSWSDHIEESAIAAWDDATQWIGPFMFESETFAVIEDREEHLVVSAKKVFKAKPDEESVEFRLELAKKTFIGRYGNLVMRQKLWELLGQCRGVQGVQTR